MNAALYLSVVLIWGTTWIALKWQLGAVPITQSIAYRFVLAAAVLFVWLLWRREVVLPRGRNARLVAAQGVFLFCFNFICFLHASRTLPSGLVAVVFASAAIWNAVLARLLYGRRLAAQVLAGGGLGLAGLLLLFGNEIGQAGRDGLIGLAWALAGTWCFSIGNLLSAAMQAQGLRPAQSNAWAMALGALLLLGWNVVTGTPFVFDPAPRYLGALLYLALPGSVIGFTAYLQLVGRIGPERTAYATVLFPVVALAVSTLFEGYAWNAVGVTGLAFILGGNVLVFSKAR